MARPDGDRARRFLQRWLPPLVSLVVMFQGGEMNKHRNILLSIISFVILALPLHAEMYKFVNEKGVTVYTNSLSSVPAEQRPEEKNVKSSIPNNAQSNTLFPDEDLSNIQLILADPDNSAFVLRNKAREEQKGFLGDLIGTKEWEVYEISYDGLKLKTIEHLVDRKGNPYEQPTGTRIGLSWSGANCYKSALPWLNGGWELAYDPDNSKTDWMFFNNETCKFGLVYHDGNKSGLHYYYVKHNRDGTFDIWISGRNTTHQTRLTASADRSKVYNESGAYYTKFTDNFREYNIK